MLWEFQIAEHLHMTVGAVREMPALEFVEWQAYLLRKHQQQQLMRK